MNAPDPQAYTAENLASLNVDAATLGELAGSRPDLRAAILAHPNCYPGLATWIHQQQTPNVAPNPAPVAQSSAGMPTYAGGGYAVQPAVKEPFVWTRAIVPIATFLAIISLFLPVATVKVYGYTISANYFSVGNISEGVILLVIMLAALALAVVTILTGKKALRITAGVVGIVAGLLGMFDGFGTMANAANTPLVSVGAGAVLLALSSLAILAFAIVTLIPAKQR